MRKEETDAILANCQKHVIALNAPIKEGQEIKLLNLRFAILDGVFYLRWAKTVPIGDQKEEWYSLKVFQDGDFK